MAYHNVSYLFIKSENKFFYVNNLSDFLKNALKNVVVVSKNKVVVISKNIKKSAKTKKLRFKFYEALKKKDRFIFQWEPLN